MKFRSARHTNNLDSLITFYRNVLGFEVLGSFKGHDGYDGVFLGIPGADWHLEFTISDEAAKHKPDEDDLLVFYPASIEEYERIIQRFTENNNPALESKNPYWKANGITYADPDGYRIVIVKPVAPQSL
ncbi:VOC family protein [Flavobacterium sp. DGU11]|uniref:VOC family protein n=1 Tax=Flavobacterium arundinis TaxID=3139143 RepID=A0ABU9HRX3_9FLAO